MRLGSANKAKHTYTHKHTHTPERALPLTLCRSCKLGSSFSTAGRVVCSPPFTARTGMPVCAWLPPTRSSWSSGLRRSCSLSVTGSSWMLQRRKLARSSLWPCRCVYMCACACMCCLYPYAGVCICVHMRVFVCACVCMCVLRLYPYAGVCICVHMRVCLACAHMLCSTCIRRIEMLMCNLRFLSFA